MKLSSILNNDLIFCGLKGDDRDSVYSNMLEKMDEHISIPIDQQQSILDVKKREDDLRLPYEKGLALPHLRKPEYDDLYVAVGILEKPVQIKPNDIEPCQVVVFSLISQNTSDLYLKAISAFARFAMQEGNLEKLAECKTAEDAKRVFDQANAVIKKEITAEDIMEVNFPAIGIDAPVSDALDMFSREGKIELPVLDADQKLVGVLEASEIIHKSIPEYIYMMDNLKFLTSFEPFENLLKKEQNMMVKDYIRAPKATVSTTVPLIQFTVTLVKGEAKNIFVVDGDNKLIGVITVQEILNKILRGL